MARAGDELINDITGLRTIFRKTAKDTNGELLQVDWIGNPGWVAGEKHIHLHQEERFEVISGTLRSSIDGKEATHHAGDVIAAPAGSVHTVWNAGNEPVHVRVEFRPALRSETVLECLAALAQDGKTDEHGAPRSLLQAAVMLHEFAPELAPAKPPLAIQRPLFALLGAIGRWRGYRPEYPYRYRRQPAAQPAQS
jgi:quercetin dioxygenase-like cupin family protein